MPRYSPTERIGINAVEAVVVNDLRWIFREQPIADMGIDAHIELVGPEPTGKLIAAQIKTGLGNFRETSSALVYYISDVHYSYWIGHSLPVVLIAHLPDTGQTLWTLVNESTVEETPKGWKVSIPRNRVFGKESVGTLTTAFDGSPREQRLRQLAIHEPLMRHIKSGRRVSVDIEDWYNKSLGRSPITVYVYDEHEDETVAMEWFQLFTGRNMKKLVELMFPWATASLDHNFYDEHDEFEESFEDKVRRATDEDNGIGPYTPDPDAIYPYSDSSGEVASYRLKLSLNTLGLSFLALSDYLDENSPQS